MTWYLGNPHDSPVWQEISDEVDRARAKFPRPDGLLTALVEEVGEIAKALLDEPWADVRKEGVQVIAMALRLIEEGDPTLADIRARRDLDGPASPTTPTAGASLAKAG